jgi:hypothetical protein
MRIEAAFVHAAMVATSMTACNRQLIFCRDSALIIYTNCIGYFTAVLAPSVEVEIVDGSLSASMDTHIASSPPEQKV